MILSRDRILTTHVGSLPRNETLSALLVAREEGGARPGRAGVGDGPRGAACRRKAGEAGIDIGNDGEQQRSAFRLMCRSACPVSPGNRSAGAAATLRSSPNCVRFVAPFSEAQPDAERAGGASRASIHDLEPIIEENRALEKSAEEWARSAECFMTAPSPGIISTTMLNAYYDSHEAYLAALAREMSNEYLAIHQAGLDPANRRARSGHGPLDVLSRSRRGRLREAPREARGGAQPGDRGYSARPRATALLLGNWEGPHIFDVPLATILPVLYQANVGALSIEFANPRHQHEYEALQEASAADMVAAAGRGGHHHVTSSSILKSWRAVSRKRCGGRRSRARHCQRGLRLRNLHRTGMGDRARGVVQAQGHSPGRRSRLGSFVGQEGRVRPLSLSHGEMVPSEQGRVRVCLMRLRNPSPAHARYRSACAPPSPLGRGEAVCASPYVITPVKI